MIPPEQSVPFGVSPETLRRFASVVVTNEMRIVAIGDDFAGTRHVGSQLPAKARALA